MCLAIAPNTQSSSGILRRLWRGVSSTPLRLLWFCALLHALVLGGLFLFSAENDNLQNRHAYVLAMSYGILALVAYGFLLTWVPQKYALSPVHYGRYNTIYLFMMAGLAMLEAGIVSGRSWMLAGTILLVPAWMVALQSLNNLHIWIDADSQPLSRLLIAVLKLNFASLILSVVGLYFHASLLTVLTISFSILLVWPLMLVAVVVLVLNAKTRARVISP